MKSISLAAVCLLMWTASWAQTPSKFNYQAVARDGAGDLVASSTVAVKVSILSCLHELRCNCCSLHSTCMT